MEELPESLNSEAYAYDNIDLLVDFKRGRISGGSIPSPTTWSRFDFNASGDRNSSESDAETLSYSSNSTHQYTGIHYSSGKSISPTYSLNGNMLAYDTSSYVYNDENELVSYSGSSVNAQYSSDPFGRRISKTVDGIQTKFFFYGARVIEERNDSDIVQASYVDCARIDDKIMMERNGKHYFYLSNHIGSIVAVVDDTAGVVEIYRYKPFGQPSIVLSSGIGNPYLFTGREWNTESQTYHYRARQYDPFIGRFLNPNTRGFIDGEIAQCYGGPLYYQQVPRPPWWVSPQPDNPYALTPLQPWMVGEWLKWFKRMLANPSIWEASLRDVDPDNVQDELVSTVNRQIDGINSQIKKLKEEYAYYADQTLLRKDTFADARLQWIPGEIDRLEKERAEWNKLLEEILKICEEISAPIRVM